MASRSFNQGVRTTPTTQNPLKTQTSFKNTQSPVISRVGQNEVVVGRKPAGGAHQATTVKRTIQPVQSKMKMTTAIRQTFQDFTFGIDKRVRNDIEKLKDKVFKPGPDSGVLQDADLHKFFVILNRTEENQSTPIAEEVFTFFDIVNVDAESVFVHLFGYLDTERTKRDAACIIEHLVGPSHHHVTVHVRIVLKNYAFLRSLLRRLKDHEKGNPHRTFITNKLLISIHQLAQTDHGKTQLFSAGMCDRIFLMLQLEDEEIEYNLVKVLTAFYRVDLYRDIFNRQNDYNDLKKKTRAMGNLIEIQKEKTKGIMTEHPMAPGELTPGRFCYVCEKFIWKNQTEGYVCFRCTINCHKDCLDRLPADCTGSPSQQNILFHAVRRELADASVKMISLILKYTTLTSSLKLSIQSDIDKKALVKGERIYKSPICNVYKGTYHGKPVAIKIMDPQSIAFEWADFYKEVTLQRICNHPNIARCLGSQENKLEPMILTELYSKGNLKELIEAHKETDKRFSTESIIILLLGIASALDFLHSKNLIHRDIKSANVLISDHFTAHLIDFGVSRVIDITGRRMSIIGTPIWTAPEVLNSEVYMEKADVYSFALLAYEVITLKHPYEGIKSLDIVDVVVKEQHRPALPKDMNPHLSEMITSCWAQDSRQRPSLSDVIDFLWTIPEPKSGVPFLVLHEQLSAAALAIVTQYLGILELYNCSLVCKSWFAAVRRPREVVPVAVKPTAFTNNTSNNNTSTKSTGSAASSVNHWQKRANPQAKGPSQPIHLGRQRTPTTSTSYGGEPEEQISQLREKVKATRDQQKNVDRYQRRLSKYLSLRLQNKAPPSATDDSAPPLGLMVISNSEQSASQLCEEPPKGRTSRESLSASISAASENSENTEERPPVILQKNQQTQETTQLVAKLASLDPPYLTGSDAPLSGVSTPASDSPHSSCVASATSGWGTPLSVSPHTSEGAFVSEEYVDAPATRALPVEPMLVRQASGTSKVESSLSNVQSVPRPALRPSPPIRIAKKPTNTQTLQFRQRNEKAHQQEFNSLRPVYSHVIKQGVSPSSGGSLRGSSYASPRITIGKKDSQSEALNLSQSPNLSQSSNLPQPSNLSQSNLPSKSSNLPQPSNLPQSNLSQSSNLPQPSNLSQSNLPSKSSNLPQPSNLPQSNLSQSSNLPQSSNQRFGCQQIQQPEASPESQQIQKVAVYASLPAPVTPEFGLKPSFDPISTSHPVKRMVGSATLRQRLVEHASKSQPTPSPPPILGIASPKPKPVPKLRDLLSDDEIEVFKQIQIENYEKQQKG